MRSLKNALADYERQLIAYALHASGGRVEQAARVLSVTRPNLAKRCRTLGIKLSGDSLAGCPTYAEWTSQLRGKLIEDALWTTSGDVRAASELLQAVRSSVIRHMERLNIDPDDYRPADRRTGTVKARKEAQKIQKRRPRKRTKTARAKR